MALAGREKSMTFLWFVVASTLIAIVGWIAYDEVIGRRTWKHYAAQWEAMEVARLEKAIAQARQSINKNELKQIRLEQEKIENLLRSEEYLALQEKAKEAKINYDDARTDLQFAKADLDEAYYVWKHAQHKGLDFADYKKRYADIEAKVKVLTEAELKAEQAYIATQKQVQQYDNQLKELKSRENKLFAKIEPLKRQLKAAKARGAPIEQFVVEDLGKSGPVIWGGVDRCTSCHIPTLISGHENGKQPFQTHPHLAKIFDAHPAEDYGCVTCHGGQGRATQTKQASLSKGDFVHGFEKHWLNPLLRGDFIQASCNKCHVQQLNNLDELAPVYSEGKRLFVEYGCINCHKVKGMEWAQKSGPDLTKIKEKVYPEWMKAWLENTKDYLPDTKMPQPRWYHPKEEIIQTMAYILDKSQGFDFKYGEFPGGNPAEGEKVFKSVGCFACHAVDGKGGVAAPALDKVAQKTTAKWIYNWILEPKSWSKHARMPSLRLSRAEAANITAYLKDKGQPLQKDEALRVALLEEKNIKEGFRVINSYGCYACHNIQGFENMSRPSVELSNFGRKDVHELAYGDAKIPHTWEAWTDGKLKDTQMFVDERSTSYMPQPNLTDQQRHALVVFLRGQRPEQLPEKYIAYDPVVEKGRQLVQRYNCRSCHMVEGQGGDVVANLIAEPNDLPPNLATTGARLTTEWMYKFLKDPDTYPKIRSWLDIRMPTFGFTDEETDALVQYFKKIADVDTLLEDKIKGHITTEYLEAGRQLIGIENFNCASCHIVGNQYPAAGPTVWAPNLAYGNNRLRPEWVNRWIRNPGVMIPGIRMPGYYPEPGTGPQNILGGDDDKQVQAIVDYLMYLGQKGGVVTGPIRAKHN